jgi:hypothetical protein
VNRIYSTAIAIISFTLLIISCSRNEEDNYIDPNETDDRQSNVVYGPVRFDLSQTPFPKLSDYHFFVGPLKDNKP